MNDAARFEMFAYWRTSATYRVRVALALKGLHAEERFVNLDAGEQRSEAFLRINPLGAIPALIDREAPAGTPPLTQSLAILEYLEDVQPDPAMLPPDPAGRARVRSLAGMLASDTHPLIVPRVIKYLTASAGFDAPALLAWRRKWLTDGLQAFEHRLAVEAGTGTFCHGEQITISPTSAWRASRSSFPSSRSRSPTHRPSTGSSLPARAMRLSFKPRRPASLARRADPMHHRIDARPACAITAPMTTRSITSGKYYAPLP